MKRILIVFFSIIIIISIYEFYINFTASGLLWQAKRLERKTLYMKDKEKILQASEKSIILSQKLIRKSPYTKLAAEGYFNLANIYSRLGLYSLAIESEKEANRILKEYYGKMGIIFKPGTGFYEARNTHFFEWYLFCESEEAAEYRKFSYNMEIDELRKRKEAFGIVLPKNSKILNKENIEKNYEMIIEKYRGTEEEAWARIDLGRLYIGLGEYTEAIEQYQIAQSLVFIRDDIKNVLNRYIEFCKVLKYKFRDGNTHR